MKSRQIRDFFRLNSELTAFSYYKTSYSRRILYLVKFLVDFNCLLSDISGEFQTVAPNIGSNKGTFKIPLFAVFEISCQIRENSLIWSSLIWSHHCTVITSVME